MHFLLSAALILIYVLYLKKCRFLDLFLRLLIEITRVIFSYQLISLFLNTMSENGEQSNSAADNQGQGEYIKLKVVGQVSLFLSIYTLFFIGRQ
jgi:hypothetical protein